MVTPQTSNFNMLVSQRHCGWLLQQARALRNGVPSQKRVRTVMPSDGFTKMETAFNALQARQTIGSSQD